MADLTSYHPQAKVAFDNSPYARAIYWPFVRPDGSSGIQTRVELWDGSAAVALDQQTREVYVIRRRRPSRQGNISVLELPNGGIDPGCTPLQTAQQELLEEAGVQAIDTSDWIQLSPEHGLQPIDSLAITNQHAFLCLRAKRTQQPELNEAEAVMLMSFRELIAIDNSNGFHDPLTPYFIRRSHDWLQRHRPEFLR